MKSSFLALSSVFFMLAFFSCATVTEKPVPVEAPASTAQQVQAQKQVQQPTAKNYKRKIGIARFSNETNYGRALMTNEEYDRVGKQASDMLASKLVLSGKFLVFERPDLSKVREEQNLSAETQKLVGVDSVIIGSLTEFGRSVSGKVGFLSSTKVQVAKAKVDIRLVDVKTGQAFFSAIGAGEASTESGEIAGFGSKAAYDATLNDRAISAAISDLVDRLVSVLEERPWKTDILDVQGKQVIISGGQRQGLSVGDALIVMSQGALVKSKQTGFDIALPAKQVAKLTVQSFFGDSENNEGSICEVTSGSVDPTHVENLFVQEARDEDK